jgi:hypothetical protein
MSASNRVVGQFECVLFAQLSENLAVEATVRAFCVKLGREPPAFRVVT